MIQDLGQRAIVRVFSIVFAALALAGCETVKDSFRVNEVVGFANTDSEIGCKSEPNSGNIGSIQPINLQCFRFPGAAAGSKTAYELALDCAMTGGAGTGSEKQCVFYRNELQSIVMRRANAICDAHKGDILAQAALINLGLGVSSTATSVLGAVVRGIQAKTNLAAVTAFLTGSQAIMNQELYQKHFAGTVISAIDTSRANKKGEIDQRRQQASNVYTIDDALIDVQEYHYRCAFYHGVSQITKAVERQDQTSRAKLLQRIEALRAEADKTSKMTSLDGNAKKRLTDELERQIKDLQGLIKTTID